MSRLSGECRVRLRHRHHRRTHPEHPTFGAPFDADIERRVVSRPNRLSKLSVMPKIVTPLTRVDAFDGGFWLEQCSCFVSIGPPSEWRIPAEAFLAKVGQGLLAKSFKDFCSQQDKAVET